MSNDAECDLAAFLAALPVYQRKQFEDGLSSYSQGEMNQWIAWMAATPEQFDALSQEHSRLIQRVPAKLRAYRKLLNREHGAGSADALGLSKGSPGRKRNDELAERIWNLRDAGKTSREIQETLRAEGRNLSTEAVEAYLKTRRRIQPQ